jgi:Tol biopolymer transport system component
VPTATAAAAPIPTPSPTATSTPSPTPKPTPQLTLNAQAIIDKSKMVMYQLSEYGYKTRMTVKTSNMELALTDQGNFQPPDKIKGVAEYINEKKSYIVIGTTCFIEIEAYGVQTWSQDECDGDNRPYTKFIPTKDTLMDLGVNTTPELIEGKQGRPTAYLIDNGGSTDLSLIQDTAFYQDFFDDDGPGIPQKFRIRYWINAANFRLMDLVISFYIPPDSVTNGDEFGFKEGSFVDVAFVLEYRPLTERIPDIKAPSIATPTPAPTPTPTPTPTPEPIRTIVLASNVDGDWEIYHYQPTQQGVSLFISLTDNDANDGDPQFSPDGESILFGSDRDGNWEIYVMGVFGTDQKNLTNNSAADSSPSWSPDGKKIVFTSDRGGDQSIYTMDADGSNQEEVLSLPGKDLRDPVYSPDGGMLAFITKGDDGGDIYLYRFALYEGGKLSGSQDVGAKYGLTWSPDGSSLMFHGDPDPTDGYSSGELEIFTIDPRPDAEVKRLTDNWWADAFGRFATDGINFYYITQPRGQAAKIYSRNLDPDALNRYNIPEVPERLTTLHDNISEMYFDINGKSINPVTWAHFFNTGVTYLNLGLRYYEHAIKAFTEAIRLDPEVSDNYQYRGEAYEAIGKSTEAEADYAKARELRSK